MKPSPPLALFLCRGNSGPSIMAEAILRHLPQGRVLATSAGAAVLRPVSPYALECLRAHRIETRGLRAKVWDDFSPVGKHSVRFLIALCSDLDAVKAHWPPRTLISTWNLPDPDDVIGNETDTRLAFEELFGMLLTRIRRFLSLRLEELEDKRLVQELARIAVLPA